MVERREKGNLACMDTCQADVLSQQKYRLQSGRVYRDHELGPHGNNNPQSQHHLGEAAQTVPKGNIKLYFPLGTRSESRRGRTFTGLWWTRLASLPPSLYRDNRTESGWYHGNQA